MIAADGVTAYKESKGEDSSNGSRKKQELDLTVEPSLDSLRLYLRSIGSVDLLTADQEVELAKRIERGDMDGEAAHGGGQPAAGRVDREVLSRAGTEPARSDPGGVARV